MLVELYTICDILDQPNKETGESKFIKKNVLVKRQFDSTKTRCEQYLTKKGDISKSFTNVYEDGSYYKVKGSYDIVKAKLEEPLPLKIKGYIAHAKKGNYKS